MVNAELDDFGDAWAVVLNMYNSPTSTQEIESAFKDLVEYDRADIQRALKLHTNTFRYPPSSKNLMALS